MPQLAAAASSVSICFTLKNAFLRMEVTLLGMVTEVRPVQSRKASPPMVVTLLGMVTEVRPLQPKKVR